jgi:hypothetical protein
MGLKPLANIFVIRTGWRVVDAITKDLFCFETPQKFGGYSGLTLHSRVIWIRVFLETSKRRGIVVLIIFCSFSFFLPLILFLDYKLFQIVGDLHTHTHIYNLHSNCLPIFKFYTLDLIINEISIYKLYNKCLPIFKFSILDLIIYEISITAHLMRSLPQL